MNPRIRHRYVAEIRPAEGPIITVPLPRIDWTPALEWARFQQVRRGAASLASAAGLARIRPHWDEQAGRPYVASLEVSTPDRDGEACEEIPLPYLSGAVRAEVGALVEAGRIAAGALYTWRVFAYETEIPATDPPGQKAFVIEEATPVELNVATRRLGDLIHRAVRHGHPRDRGTPPDFPVFFSTRVLEEAATAATAAGEYETGGVLLGGLSRDEASGDLIVEVTAQIPALDAVAANASLRFTPATWQAVHAAIALRRGKEHIVGWYHSHPRSVWPCHACPPERRATCSSNRAFFSEMDLQFHRTAFPGPINVALLLSFHDDPAPRYDLFGWHRGSVAPRDYYVLEKPDVDPR